MADPDGFFDRIEKTEDIADVRHGNQPGARGQKSLQTLREQVSIFFDRPNFQLRFLAVAKHLPGNDIGMVFRLRHDDLVTLINKRFSKGESNEVNGGRRAGSKNDFFPSSRMDPLLYTVSGPFVFFRGHSRKKMHGPMRISIRQLIDIQPFIQNSLRFLGCCGIVQIYQVFPVNLAG